MLKDKLVVVGERENTFVYMLASPGSIVLRRERSEEAVRVSKPGSTPA